MLGREYFAVVQTLKYREKVPRWKWGHTFYLLRS